MGACAGVLERKGRLYRRVQMNEISMRRFDRLV